MSELEKVVLSEREILFETKHMHKAFGPTIAIKDVDFRLYRGEIRGLVGENGSGKSTIMSIASGMQPPTSGEMFFKGQPWSPQNMVEAQEAGISMILQEVNTIPGVTVAQNIFAGHEKDFAKLGFINMPKLVKKAQALLEKFGIFHIRGKDSIDKYSFEDRKLIEVVRCVTDDTQVLVVDETTTALSHDVRDILYKIVHKMADEENKAVVFISHDLDEVLDECNVITVLRDGEITGDISSKDTKTAKDPEKRQGMMKKIRRMMVGREIGEKYYREDYDTSHRDEVAIELKNVSFGFIKDFSLTVHKGEMVGLGGLSGCGMHEIGRAAFGLEKLSRGEIIRSGKKIDSPLTAIQQGIGYISKNRDMEALILDGSIKDNILLPSLDELSHYSFINPRDEKRIANGEIDAFSIKCRNGKQWVNTLSGGNKQKVSFAKWTAKGSDVIIMDCPTRGVDVGVKQAMYAFMEKMKKQGRAILMISEELSELIGMSDKMIIMKDFKVTKEFIRSSDLKEADIIDYMI